MAVKSLCLRVLCKIHGHVRICFYIANFILLLDFSFYDSCTDLETVVVRFPSFL